MPQSIFKDCVIKLHDDFLQEIELANKMCQETRDAERERCAKLCEEINTDNGECPKVAIFCAKRIRGDQI
jgi:hypothetical protein